MQLLTEARDAWDIEAEGQVPFRLVLDIQVEDLPCHQRKCRWTFEWYSEQQWRQELKIPFGRAVTIRDGERMRTRSPKNTPINLLAWRLVNALSISHHLAVAGEDEVKKAKQKGDRSRIVLVTPARDGNSPRRRVVVIEGQPPRLSAVHSEGPVLHYEYGREEVAVGERAFPKEVRVVLHGKTVATATVDSAGPPSRPVEEALTVPDEAAQRSRPRARPSEAAHCETFQPPRQVSGERIRLDHSTKDPWPAIVVKYVVGVDGRVVKAEVLESPRPSVEKRALKTMRRWRFEPALCDGQPIQTTQTRRTQTVWRSRSR